MILLPSHNLILITPGKTASTSLRAELASVVPDIILLHGPQGNNTDYNKHTAKVPEALPESMRNPAVAVITRNPFDRAVSLWKHFVRHGKREITFPDYVDQVLTNDQRWWFFRFTIMQTLEGTRFDRIIRFESLLPDLQGLGIPLKSLSVRHGSGDATPWESYYNVETRDAVKLWGAADFEAFGYDATALDHFVA